VSPPAAAFFSSASTFRYVSLSRVSFGRCPSNVRACPQGMAQTGDFIDAAFAAMAALMPSS
jgi:hypothetical protein